MKINQFIVTKKLEKGAWARSVYSGAVAAILLVIATSAQARMAPEGFTGTDLHSLDSNYEPTILDSEAQAQEILSRLERRFREKILFFPRASQCTARATVWTTQMERQWGIKAMKVFMFFSPTYKKEFHHKWWFHVAPYVWVRTPQGIEERVLDPAFSDRPLSMKDWSDLFMANEAECAIQSEYNYPFEYPARLSDASPLDSGAQPGKYCHFTKVPMYYHFPADIEARDDERQVRDEWNQDSVKIAFSYLKRSVRKKHPRPELN